MRIFILLLLFVLTSCDETETPPSAQDKQEEKLKPSLVLSEETFNILPNWGADDFKTFTPALNKSCARILKKPAHKSFGALSEAGTYGDWQRVCKIFGKTDKSDPTALQIFFENNFSPYKISADNEANGLFTGYYEASLKGSKIKRHPYIYPLYKRPDDLIMLHLGDFRDNLKGIRIAGRVESGYLKPYESREDIVSGNWPHNNEVLVWVDDAVDAFFVQIQGSGLVKMDDGSTMRIGYAGQNGHIYYAIGRELIKSGAITKEDISMQSIRAWLNENPEHADQIMNTNKSYVFFREVIGDGPLGAEGIALTAHRSLAIDRTLIPYGLPLWVDIENPIKNEKPIQRLMIAQDTGGAITGPVRADLFWGYGDRAEYMAGKMKSKGRYWALLPNINHHSNKSP